MKGVKQYKEEAYEFAYTGEMEAINEILMNPELSQARRIAYQEVKAEFLAYQIQANRIIQKEPVHELKFEYYLEAGNQLAQDKNDGLFSVLWRKLGSETIERHDLHDGYFFYKETRELKKHIIEEGRLKARRKLELQQKRILKKGLKIKQKIKS